MNGTLYRTGTNVQYLPADPNRFHWFDGDGMVHAFRLQDGRASYCNRWVNTEGLQVERAAGRQLYNGIYEHNGTPRLPLPAGASEIKMPVGINVIKLGKRVLTMHEAEGHYWQLDPETLETIGMVDFDGQISGMLTAHPHFDHVKNEWLFYSLDNEENFIECFSTDPEGQIKTKHRVPLSFTPWNHDVIFSADYMIFFFGIISWRPRAADRVPEGKSSWFVDPASGEDAKILLVRRDNGEAKWLLPENSAYVLGHFLNAYQQGDEIILDASVTRVTSTQATFNPEDYYPFPLVPGPSAFADPELWRFTINPSRGSVEHQRIGDFSAEFVRPNEFVMGTPHRFGYMACVHGRRGESKGFNGLAKHDYQTGVTQFQHLPGDHDFTPGEPIVVVRPNATSEDDGWILALWYDPRRNASEMVILDAKRFDAEPVARIRLDHRVPSGFHGNWIVNS
ncbi:MAG: carotenoid oxygenase family protein [Janthinobacterium lividum]